MFPNHFLTRQSPTRQIVNLLVVVFTLDSHNHNHSLPPLLLLAHDAVPTMRDRNYLSFTYVFHNSRSFRAATLIQNRINNRE